MTFRITILAILVFSFSALISSCVSHDKNEEFWIWFSKNQTELYKSENNKGEVFDVLQRKLIELDSNLVFEFSPVHENGIKEFTISADGLRESFPSVKILVSKAPKLTNWQINAFRQRVPGDGIKIVYDDTIEIAYEDIYFTYKIDSKEIGVELNIRDYQSSSSFDNATYILLDQLIGEYDMGTRISSIERKKLEETKVNSLHKIIELRRIIDSLKNQK